LLLGNMIFGKNHNQGVDFVKHFLELIELKFLSYNLSLNSWVRVKQCI